MEKVVYLLTDMGLAIIIQMLWTSMIGGNKVIPGVASHTSKGLGFLRELIEAGKLKAVIDRTYPLKKLSRLIGMLKKGTKRKG